MDADAVLLRARSGNVPSNWTVWPLRRNIVLRSALGWSFIGIVGLAFLAAVAAATIPGNFTRDGVSFACTGVILMILAIMGFGGIGIAIIDFRRIAQRDEYLLVMTPEDYVKAEPGKVTHVPMEHVAYVTLRGVKLPVERDIELQQNRPSAVSHMLGAWVGNFGKPRVAPSLAFVDTRTDREVVVCTDNSFDEMIAVEQTLLIHAGNKERTHTG